MLSQFGFSDGMQFIDGSFVENVELRESKDPNDIDVFSFLVRPANYRNNPAQWNNIGYPQWTSEIADRNRNKLQFGLALPTRNCQFHSKVRWRRPVMKALSRAVWVLILATTSLGVVLKPGSADECVPISTRPSESVRLLPHPVGLKRLERQLSVCRASTDAQTRFAEATILVNVGDLEGAIARLTPLSQQIHRAALLLADILTERAGSDQAMIEKAWHLYQPFAECNGW